MGKIFVYKTIGGSMRPLIKSNQLVWIEKADPVELKAGDMVLYEQCGAKFIHRIFLGIFIIFLIIVLVPTITNANSSQNKYLDQDLEKVADKLYKEAKEKYVNAEYWNCARDLIILVDF